MVAKESPWEITGAAGLSVSDGNSDSVAYSVQFLASYLKDGEEAYFGADYFFAEDGGVESTNSLNLFGQYNHDLNERWYVGGRGSYFQDEVANIDYRVDAGILLGYRVINQERMKLSFEFGPGYAWEKQGVSQSDFATLRLAQRFEYQISKTSKLWQSLAWTPRADQLSDGLIEFEAGLETRVTRQMSLRGFLRHRYDDTPAAGRERSDTALLFGLAYDLGGLPEPDEAGDGRRSLMPGEEDAGEDEKGWTSIAALGFSLNQGNSDRLGYNLAWNSVYREAAREFFFDLGYNYSEDNKTTSTDRLASRIQYNYHFDGPMYLGASIGYLSDELAAIDYRAIPALLAGYSLIDEKKTSLAFEAGPSYTFQKSGGISSNFASMVAAERFSHTFNERFSLKQSLVYTAELADFGNSNVVASAALDTKLRDRLIWRIGLDYNYENQPASGRRRHDTLLTSAVAMKF
jgi:putative salt-induced outer membrane protein YdiY